MRPPSVGSKLTVPALRTRVLASLVNVSPELAATVAAGLGMPVPPALPREAPQPAAPELKVSPALSLHAQPGDGGIRSRCVAILLTDGFDGHGVTVAHKALLAAGAQVKLIAARLGAVKPAEGAAVEATATFENAAPVLFDGVVVPDGAAAVKRLGTQVAVLDFISNQHRHGKTLLMLGTAKGLLERAGCSARLADGAADPGVVLGKPADDGDAVGDFITALGKHRHPEREAAAMAAAKV